MNYVYEEIPKYYKTVVKFVCCYVIPGLEPAPITAVYTRMRKERDTYLVLRGPLSNLINTPGWYSLDSNYYWKFPSAFYSRAFVFPHAGIRSEEHSRAMLASFSFCISLFSVILSFGHGHQRTMVLDASRL